MEKRVLLLAVSCKEGGLCPGGIDLDNPRQWIRIVNNDGNAGSVHGKDIDFAFPLDVIKFNGRPMPQGKQQENWVIDNGSCKKCGRLWPNSLSSQRDLLNWAYQNYAYHGFWGNYRAYLNRDEFDNVTEPSESILKVTDVRIYKNKFNRAKIDFTWSGARFPIKGISMTDPDFYSTDDEDIIFDEAYIVISIPKECDWIDPRTGEPKAYKFVSKVFQIG